MNDLVILGISMSGVVLLTGLVLFFITERQSDKRALELKQFQMENTRLIQEWRNESRKSQDEHMAFFQGIMQSIARVIRKQEDGEGPK